MKLTILPDTQNGFVFLQALSSDVYVESLGSNFDGNSAHGGIKVRPCTTGTVSTLQLLPGQSFYLGKTTLSLVPQEYGDLPIDSSSLPDSDFEHYHHQVSQIGTPQTGRLGSSVMETPMLHRDHQSEHFTPILEQITGQAISKMEDIKDWPENPLKRKIIQTVRGANDHGRSSSQSELRRNEHAANAATNEPDRSSPQSHVKSEDGDMANAAAARLLEQKVVDLEDVDMAGADIESEMVEKSEPSPSIKSRVHLEGEPGGPSRSLILEKSKPLSSPLAQMCPAGSFSQSLRRVEGAAPRKLSTNRGNSPGFGVLSDSPTLAASNPLSLSVVRVEPERGAVLDQSHIRAISPSGPQTDDDHHDNPVGKRAKTVAVPNEDLTEESQDSLQKEVISIYQKLTTRTRPNLKFVCRANQKIRVIIRYLTYLTFCNLAHAQSAGEKLAPATTRRDGYER